MREHALLSKFPNWLLKQLERNYQTEKMNYLEYHKIHARVFQPDGSDYYLLGIIPYTEEVHCMGYIPWIRDLQDEDGDFYGTSTYKEIDIYGIPMKWFERPDFHFVLEILEKPILNFQLYPNYNLFNPSSIPKDFWK